ncbi:MAG TPA: zf-HC2 domain-containing protein [Acidimicrobiales bacterium]|nr:zf-HC2 domain-containing protein [Acidimicrobiales bacterium]
MNRTDTVGTDELPDLPCQEFVSLVTDYLEGALDPARVAIVDAHLAVCEGCRSVLAQWREVIVVAGHLRERDVGEVDPTVRATLVDAFRRFRGPAPRGRAH